MPDVRIETTVGGIDAGEALARAKNAARAMHLGIHQEEASKFVAGNQWIWSYEIEVEIEDNAASAKLQLDGRTLKVGYNERLEARVNQMLQLIRNPGEPTPIETAPIEAKPEPPEDPDWYKPEPEDTHREETLGIAPIVVAFAVGVAASLTATLIWEGGKWAVREMRDSETSEPVDDRPETLYSPDQKMTYRKQDDGSYEPIGSVKHE